MKTLVLGMGNPILSDDGIGIWVARALEGELSGGEVTVMETNRVGLNLLELLTDFDRAILIDAIQTSGGKVGQVYRLEPETFDTMRHAITPHGLNFSTALELGNRLGLALPHEIILFAIEVADVNTFGERCTADVEQVIPVVSNMVIQEVNGGYNA